MRRFGMATEISQSPHSFDVSGHRVLLVHDLGEVINKRSIASHGVSCPGLTPSSANPDAARLCWSIRARRAAGLRGKCTAIIVDLESGEIEIVTL